jgi:hypothetical protein
VYIYLGPVSFSCSSPSWPGHEATPPFLLYKEKTKTFTEELFLCFLDGGLT